LFKNHTANAPDECRKIRSPWPSPLRSPVATIRQPAGNEATFTVEATWAPFNSQIPIPPESFCQARSRLPSPLKSGSRVTASQARGLTTTDALRVVLPWPSVVLVKLIVVGP
jgi:hypothetical protein